MSVNCVQIGNGSRHQAPSPGGPIAEILIGDSPGRQMGAVRVTVPPCGQMGLHEHGRSETLLIPLHGSIRLVSGGDDGEVTMLEPGVVVTIPIGEKVRLDNPEAEPGRMLVVFSPPEFTSRLADWPSADIGAAAPVEVLKPAGPEAVATV